MDTKDIAKLVTEYEELEELSQICKLGSSKQYTAKFVTYCKSLGLELGINLSENIQNEIRLLLHDRIKAIEHHFQRKYDAGNPTIPTIDDKCETETALKAAWHCLSDDKGCESCEFAQNNLNDCLRNIALAALKLGGIEPPTPVSPEEETEEFENWESM